MKNLILLCLVMFLTQGCKKKDGNEQVDNFVSTKIDGVNWYANMVSWVKQEHTMGGSLLQMEVNRNGEKLILRLINYNGVNTYQTDGGEFVADYLNGSVVYRNLREKGKLVVTKDKDGYIEGTFEFIGNNEFRNETKNITDGKFKVKINNAN